MTTLIILFLAIIGACIGSFLNVVIHRLPQRQSIISPPSHCPRCSIPIRYIDNIPILGYILLWGKCRACGEKISIVYPLVELLTAMGFLLVFFSNGFMIDILLAKNLVFLSFGVAIIFIDIKHYIIPDVLSIPLVVIGLGLAFFTDEPGWMSSLLGSVVGFSLFYLIAFSYFKRKKVDGLGGGDIKLIAGIGAFIGVVGVFYVMFLSSFIALLVFSVKLILEHKRRTVSGEDCAAQDIIPFGPFLVVATIVYMLFGGKMLEWYMSLFYGWL